MKPRNFRKKLSLNKITVAALNTDAMKVIGGGDTVDIDCLDPSYNTCGATYCGSCRNTCDCISTDCTEGVQDTCYSICVTWPCAYCYN